MLSIGVINPFFCRLYTPLEGNKVLIFVVNPKY